MTWEQNGRADCCFVEGDKILASFEIKPFFPISVNTVMLGKILADFQKQWLNAKKKPSVGHYVVLVPHGQVDSIETWIMDCLKKKIRQEYPLMTLADVPAPKPIKLNDEADGYAVVKVFLVGSLAQ
jgi:hypothetical protein